MVLGVTVSRSWRFVQLTLWGEPDRVQVRPSLGSAAWLRKKPGYWKDEARRMNKRLTDHQFVIHHCSHRGNDGGLCRGPSRKDWSS